VTGVQTCALPIWQIVAIWATRSVETVLAVAACVLRGAVAAPVDPGSGVLQTRHLTEELRPALVLAPAHATISEPLASVPRIDVIADPHPLPRRGHAAEPSDPDAPAFVFMSSGTTGPPKGAVIPRRAVASNLDALASVWAWTADDVVVHGLPLFHVHGLVLGVLGPLRRAGSVRHVGRFSPPAVAAELDQGGTMLFGVPTMHRDLADAAERDATIARQLARARLLVSGSAGLPPREHRRLRQLTGASILERYGLTETLMNCAEPAGETPRPGSVGPALPGVDVRLIDDEATLMATPDENAVGEIEVRGPNMFLGYHRRPDATRTAVRDGWFRTGDLATRTPDGWYRVVGRRSTDLIKSAGYRVGAGEIESALLDHPAVAEAAVTGQPDDRLGERIVAWVVLREGRAVDATELISHVAAELAPHKRPRTVRFVSALPRTAMGKVRKAALGSSEPGGTGA